MDRRSKSPVCVAHLGLHSGPSAQRHPSQTRKRPRQMCAARTYAAFLSYKRAFAGRCASMRWDPRRSSPVPPPHRNFHSLITYKLATSKIDRKIILQTSLRSVRFFSRRKKILWHTPGALASASLVHRCSVVLVCVALQVPRCLSKGGGCASMKIIMKNGSS